MPNIELLEKSTPVAPVRIAALAGCQDLANEVDKKLVKFRKELVAKKKPSQIPQGYSLPSFLVDSEIIRFGTGEGKGHIKVSPITALPTKCADTRTTCPRIIIFRI